ncbi:hypothetical protein DSO57_1016244 [Entomophthora muscae]|uniref:Uncharacterized protein n=1 Tax=Entomophthora muscae TaxID=34485 RepID=A0ACC2S6R7_9FUNG|nr:hypothetical protein DSO57_1016244 [Entomophthora muscae]
MNSFSQTSLLNPSHFAQHTNVEDYRSPPSAQPIDNQQQLNGNQGLNQVDALLEVERRAQQSQDAIMCNSNQVTRQSVDIVANNADISRKIIADAKQEIRNHQQYSSPLWRQKYQQREKLLEQLAQINEMLRLHSQLRVNTQDTSQCNSFAKQLIGLARQVQHLARDIINDTPKRRNDNIIRTPFYPKSYTGHRHATFGQSIQYQGFYGNFQ